MGNVSIYCLLIISTLIIEKVIRNKLNLPKRTKYNIKFTKKQRFIEVLIVAIYLSLGDFWQVQVLMIWVPVVH